jgi:hypothetical protein
LRRLVDRPHFPPVKQTGIRGTRKYKVHSENNDLGTDTHYTLHAIIVCLFIFVKSLRCLKINLAEKGWFLKTKT